MPSNSTYFLATGYNDEERLRVLNQVYNPKAMSFLIKSGLKEGMTVLEYGTGMGFFAIELAKYVGKNGKVVAIDANSDSLKVAEKNARNAGVSNIEFKECKIEEVNSLNRKFDLAYGRWVLIFIQDLKTTLKSIFDVLNSGGVLVCEELNFEENGSFSYPYEPLIKQFHEFGIKICKNLGLDPNLAYKLYPQMKEMYKNIIIETSQPILVTAEEKSVYRLGMMTTAKAILDNNLSTTSELEDLLVKYSELEKQDIITGFFRNVLISGRK